MNKVTDEKARLRLIPEQVILIEGIQYMRGNHALSLNTNFKLKQVLYKQYEEEVWMNYIVLNDFTAFAQLISFLTSKHIINLKSYERDGFTMLLTISSLSRL